VWRVLETIKRTVAARTPDLHQPVSSSSGPDNNQRPAPPPSTGPTPAPDLSWPGIHISTTAALISRLVYYNSSLSLASSLPLSPPPTSTSTTTTTTTTTSRLSSDSSGAAHHIPPQEYIIFDGLETKHPDTDQTSCQNANAIDAKSVRPHEKHRPLHLLLSPGQGHLWYSAAVVILI